MIKHVLILAFFFYSANTLAQEQTGGDLKVAYFVRFSELEALLISVDTNDLKNISIDEIQSLEMIHENIESVMGVNYQGQDAVMIIVLTSKGERTLKELKKLGVKFRSTEKFKTMFAQSSEGPKTYRTFSARHQLCRHPQFEKKLTMM